MSVGGVVGGVIGFVASGYNPAGFQAGYAIGSAIETSQKVIPAPKPGDLSVPASSYGAAVAEAFGPMRTGGSILWSAPLIVRVEEASGKGGPSVEVNKFFWSAVLTFGWADPRTLPLGYELRRVWVNKKLVVDLVSDIGSSADFEAALASDKFFNYCEFHGGGPDQQPPTIQQEFDGIDQTPGYAFHARLDIRDLPLTDDVGFGELQNRPPVIECEIAPRVQQSAQPVLARIFAADNILSGSIDIDRGAEHRWWSATYNEITEYAGPRVVSRGEYDGALLTGANGPIHAPWRLRQFAQRFLIERQRLGEDEQYAAESLLISAYARPVGAQDVAGRTVAVVGNAVHLYRGGALDPKTFIGHGEATFLASEPSEIDDIPAFSGALAAAVDPYCAYVAYTRLSDSALVVRRYPLQPSGGIAAPAGYVDRADLIGPNSGLVSTSGAPNLAMYVQAGGIVWVLGDKAADGRHALFRCNAGSGERELTLHAEIAGERAELFGTENRLYCDGRLVIVMSDSGMYAGRLSSSVDAGVTVGAVVRALCRRSELSDIDIDTTEIDEIPLHGYGLGARLAARPAIEQLQLHTPMTPVESGGAIRFRVDGPGDEVHDIPEDDLLEPVQLTRAQDSELPREVTVQYLSTDAGYQPGAQAARMITASGTEQVAIPIGVAMSDTTAARAAARALAMAYAQREAYTFATTLAMAEYEPGDVVRVPSAGREYVLRIITREEGQGQIKWSGKAFNKLVYTQYAVATPIAYVEQEIGLAGASALLQLSGLPPLRDADTGAGIYICYDGYGAGWHGARLQNEGRDVAGTASPYRVKIGQLRGSISAEPDTLPDFVNTVDIEFNPERNVELANVAIAECLAGAQIVAIGDEVVGITRATLVSAGVYRCTGLLRGLRGSAVSAHASRSAAIILDAVSVLRYTYESTAIGLSNTVRAVSNGQDPAKAKEVRLAHEAGTARMIAPCAIAAGRLPDGGLLIRWQRRGRFDQLLRSNGATPLDDPAEAYEVQITRGGKTRALSASSQEVVYSAADQAADGGIATSMTVTIAQLSSYAGKGRTATKTLNIPA